MKKGFWKVALSLCMAVALVFNVAAAPVYAEEKEYLNNYVHSDTDYADMVYTPIDVEGYRAVIDTLTELIALEGEADNVYDYSVRLFELFDDILTSYMLCNIAFSQDVTSEQWYNEYLSAYSLVVAAQDEIVIAFSKVANSPYADELVKIVGEEYTQEFAEYEPMTEEEMALYQQEQLLVANYEQAALAEYSVEVEGVTWTTTTLEEAYMAGEISADAYDYIDLELYKATNKALGDIFVQMVAVRNELARISGYENYADYGYAEIYGRDYTTEEIKSFYEYVKEEIVPLYNQMQEIIYNGVLQCYYEYVPESTDAIVDAVGRNIGKVNGELAEIWAYFTEHELYDIEYSDTKQNAGYTTSLPSYQSAFIFNQPYGMAFDVTTLVHEFGHFSDAYNASNLYSLVSNGCYDILEIHSQGLEALYMPYFEDMFGAYAPFVAYYQLFSLLDGVVSGCLYDEFQVEIYENPDMTLTDINKLYRRVATEYGKEFSHEAEVAYSWIDIPHTFNSPMYYISYATSAMSALDIAIEASEDYAAAVDTYMTLLSYGASDYGYQEVLSLSNMTNFFNEEEQLAFSERMEQFLATETTKVMEALSAVFGDIEQGEPAIDDAPKAGEATMVVWIAGLALLALCGLALQTVKKNERAKLVQ